MTGFERHMFICAHERSPEKGRECCAAKSSLNLMKAIKTAAKAEGIPNIRVQKSGCLSQCERGISCVVYPEAIWYSLTGETDIDAMLAHLKDGTVTEALRMKPA